MSIFADKYIESDIKSITVYRGGAFITRTAKVQLKKGRNTVAIEKLSSTIEKDSIQVGVEDSVTCLQVSYMPNINNARVDQAIDLSNTEIEKRINEVQKQLTVIDLRLEALNSMNVRFNVSDGVEKIKEYTEYNSEQLEELISKKNELHEEFKILQKKKSAEDSIKGKGIWKLLPGAISLELNSEEDFESEIEIQYFDISADWKPHYDIRIKDGKKAISFILKGNIAQNTGESWVNKEINVSTGSYGQRRYVSELPIWKVGQSAVYRGFGSSMRYDDDDEYYDTEDEGYEPKLAIPDFLSKPGKQRAAMSPAVIPGSAEKNYMGNTQDTVVIDNQNSIIYKLAEKCTVLNGKGSGTVTVIAHEIDCKLDIYTTPKLDSTAFMVAKVQNYIKYSFIKCNANVFLNNRFIGTTVINPVSDDGTMIVSLGPDNKIQVRRVSEKQLSSKSFIGGTHTQEELYAIKIINGKSVPAHIIVVDQLPVSTHVKVMVEKTTLSGGTVEETTGKVTWEIDVKPNEEKDIKFGYKIITKR